MSAERRAHLDTSALAKWYLNEQGSDDCVAFLQSLDVAVNSSLTITEMRSFFSRRSRMGDVPVELEHQLFATFLEDLDRGWLQRYPLDDARFSEATHLIARTPNMACAASTRFISPWRPRHRSHASCSCGRSE